MIGSQMTGSQHPLHLWIALRDLTQSALMAELEIPADSVVLAGYERLADVERVNNPARHPGYFFFHNGIQKMQYIGRFPPELQPYFSYAALMAELGEPDLVLRSRAGRHNRMYVYPRQGVAFSAVPGDSVDFVEIFQPMSDDDYRQQIYDEPPPFRR